MHKHIILLAVMAVFAAGPAFSGAKQDLSSDDYAYLLGIASDTWASIDYLVEPKTGLPYDMSNKKVSHTSVSNIGIYLAAVSVAAEMGFIERNDAFQRISKLLDSYDKFPSWNGFTQSWHDVLSLKPSTDDPWISILDSGNLAAGLIVARQEFPELNERISGVLDAMDWSKVYSEDKRLLIGGYNMKTGKMNEKWLLSVLGTDARGAMIVSIGSGKVPSEMWDKVSKGMEYKYGLRYYKPGWSGGGLFMQMIDTCFFDLRYTEMWKSAASFAYAQMFHAKIVDSPVWGWSACDSPDDGYLGYNNWRDYVITPHASVLPISIFPSECVANLRRLEGLGARADFEADGRKYAFGFRDSLDLAKGKPTGTFLVLDQGMLFLSLCNYLSGGRIWELSNRDPIIKNAKILISDFRANKEDFDKFMSGLYAKNVYVAVKSACSRKEIQAGVPARFKVTVICDDSSAAGKYSIRWRLFDKIKGKKLKSGAKTVSVSKGTMLAAGDFRFIPSEGEYFLQAVIRGMDGSEPANDYFEFRAVDYIDLAGEWLFNPGDDASFSSVEFADNTWDSIFIPARWDDQGYPSEERTYWWYRIHMNIPKSSKKIWSDGEVYFTAGGIDDADQVYLNGELIGSTAFPPNFREGFWDKQRNYKIPLKTLNFKGDNVLAVRVYNYIREGGIWKGPVRIMHRSQAQDISGFIPPSWEK
ncbi:MAG: glucoamylase family protein [Elusimicrobiota bacterium]